MWGMQTQSFTFFFTADHHRTTDRSLAPAWSMPKISSTILPLNFNWVAPKPA